MLDPDRRQTERKAKRDDHKVIVCPLAGLLFAIVFAGAGIIDLTALAGTGV